MKTISVYDMKGKVSGKFTLDEAFFDGKVNKALLHQAVLMYLANLRHGCAATRTRGEVSGGGRKPWKQKGTGRARAGSIRSPLWKGGGTIFGPHPKDFSYRMPQNTLALALQQSLNSKVKDEQLLVIENLSLAKPKTKELADLLGALKAERKPLLVLKSYSPDILRVGRNIAGLSIKTFNNINAHDVLKHNKIIFAQGALEDLVKMRKQ